MKRQTFPEALKNGAVAAYRGGESAAKIAKRLKTNPGVIRRWVKEAGVPLQLPRRGTPVSPTGWEERGRDSIVYLRAAVGKLGGKECPGLLLVKLALYTLEGKV